MMNESQKHAWSCLTPIEQKSLFLQTTQGKSTWEVGTILGISHYKYIEIRERSEHFFRLFADFFDIHESIFRPDAPVEPQFRDYIEGVMEKRLSRRKAKIYSGDSTQLLPKVTGKTILRNMGYLKESQDPWDIDTRKLIFEFDRWNNDRILPTMLQQPSAYKRRANKKDKIYIKYLLNKIPEYILERLKERYYYKNSGKRPKYWVCLISPTLYTDGYYLLPIRPQEDVIKECSDLYMYVFQDREDADTFGFLVSQYLDMTRDVKLGQRFWPQYRDIIRKAVNYNQVNNIEKNVKSLDMAYNKHKKQKKLKEPTLKSKGQARVEDKALYLE